MVTSGVSLPVYMFSETGLFSLSYTPLRSVPPERIVDPSELTLSPDCDNNS